MSTVTRELTTNTYTVRYEVPPSQGGLRLDLFLKEHYDRRSRETLKRAIDEGSIRVESTHRQVGRLKPASTLMAGDAVLVTSERREEPEVDFNYRVIYEDETLFVIHKPANLPVHPSGRFFFNTLLTHLQTQALTDPKRLNESYYLAHRIDKETSGILVMTKDAVSCADVVAQFADRKTEKTYLAIVRGICPEKFEVNEAMNRSTTSKIALKMVCMPESEGGLPSSTRFERLEVAGEYSLVHCYPKTGRQHQIRVHADQAGFPLVGDKLYGRDEEFALLFYERERLTPEDHAQLILPRHALHATRMRLKHPRTGKMMEFESPLPADLRAFLDAQKR